MASAKLNNKSDQYGYFFNITSPTFNLFLPHGIFHNLAGNDESNWHCENHCGKRCDIAVQLQVFDKYEYENGRNRHIDHLGQWKKQILLYGWFHSVRNVSVQEKRYIQADEKADDVSHHIGQ